MHSEKQSTAEIRLQEFLFNETEVRSDAKPNQYSFKNEDAYDRDDLWRNGRKIKIFDLDSNAIKIFTHALLNGNLPEIKKLFSELSFLQKAGLLFNLKFPLTKSVLHWRLDEKLAIDVAKFRASTRELPPKIDNRQEFKLLAKYLESEQERMRKIAREKLNHSPRPSAGSIKLKFMIWGLEPPSSTEFKPHTTAGIPCRK